VRLVNPIAKATTAIGARARASNVSGAPARCLPFSRVSSVLVMLLSTCGASASVAAPLPTSPVYLDATEAYNGLQVEPATITYTGDGTGLLGGYRVRGPNARIKWTSWTGKRARGSGFNQLNDCVPFCAHGHFHRYPVRIEMWRPAQVAGLLVFSRMTIFYLGARPRGESSHYTFTDSYRAGGGFGWGPPDREGYCRNTHGLKPAPGCSNINSLP
jgi:hypothetical protein